MKLRQLEVRSFCGIRSADIELRDGLNLLVGPNEAGKSTLAEAVRAVLLCKATSSYAERYYSKLDEGSPEVALTYYTSDGRLYRIHKEFGSNGRATLSWSRDDGATFDQDERGDGADARLAEHLSWGLRKPGGRGGPRGIQSTFLTRALLAAQAEVADILAKGFDGDAEADAQTRLIQGALAAAVEDPRFKAALAAAQKDVDQYFTATGRRKGGKGSPWTKASSALEATQRELEALEQAAARVEQLEADVEDKRAAAEHARGVREDVEARIARLEDARTRHEARAARVAEVDEAKSRLQDGQAVEQKVQQLTEELTVAARDVAAAEAGLRGAQEACARAQSDVEARQAALREAEASSDAAQLQLRRSELDRQLSELEGERASVNARKAEAAALSERERELARVREQRDAEREAKSVQQANLQRADAEVAELDREILSARAAKAREDVEAGRSRLDRARSDLRRAEAARARLGEIAAESETLAQVVEAGRGLDHAVGERIRALWAARDTARAAASAGLALRVTRLRPLEVGLVVDDEAPEARPASTQTFELSAQRRVQLDLGDVAQVAVEAGTDDARRGLEQAEAAWRSDGAPVLDAHGLDSVGALDARIREIEHARSRLESLEVERARLREDAERADAAAAERADAEAELAAAEARLAEHAGADAVTPRGTLMDLEDLRKAATKRQQTCAQVLSGHDATLAQLEPRERALDAEVETARQRVGGASLDVRAAAEARLEEIERAAGLLRAEREGLTKDLEAKRAAAADGLDAAKTALEDASGVVEAARAQLDEARGARATLQGRLTGAKEERERVDLDALRVALEAAERRLAEAPTVDFAPEDLDGSRTELESAKRALEQAESDLQRAVGALDQTGGPAALQRRDDARARLDEKRRAQEDVQLDADAAQLLVETLKEAETKLAKHVGVSLGAQVAERFAELTEARYAQVQMDKELVTQGIRFGSATLEPTQLSVGTQHQLATLLRVILAEQLRHPIVLDDQLVQSDPARLGWFRRSLRSAAEKTQIIVLSCRKEDYLDPESDAVHIVDVTKAVERVAPGGAPVP